MMYYVANNARWFVVECDNKREAERIGIEDMGPLKRIEVRRATAEEVREYVRIKGKAALGNY